MGKKNKRLSEKDIAAIVEVSEKSEQVCQKFLLDLGDIFYKESHKLRMEMIKSSLEITVALFIGCAVGDDESLKNITDDMCDNIRELSKKINADVDRLSDESKAWTLH